ncbi:MAG: hypothetical protein NTY27_06340 [Actinobacteria bacterium]|nr:hypothetical protein [Actinomycetota bacterium]
MSRIRLLAALVAAIALIGTTGGIVIAATDTNAGSSPYALNGKVPETAAMSFSIANSDGVAITGHMDVDMVRNRVDGEIDIPFILVMARIHIREVNDKLYLGAGAFQSMADADWLAAPLNTNLDLTGLALSMAKPEFDLMPKELGAVEITTEGDVTVRTYHLNSTALGLPTSGDATLVFRTASEGQVIGLTVTIKAANQDMKISLNVDSYNGPVAIAVPKPSSVKPLTSDSLQQIVGGNDTLQQLLNGLMSGGSLSSLAQNQLTL